MLLCLLVLLSVAFAQEICSSTSVGLQGGVDEYGKLQPQKVLYINIVGPSRHYESNMKLGYTMLDYVLRNKYPTSTVTYMTCEVTGCSRDLTGFTQIWVTDLSSENDLNANQLQMYKAIATWYTGKDRPPLIADGRLLSSLWPSPVNGGCCSTYNFNFPGRDRPNPRLMENYFVSLALRGGGIMLGTDHNAFTDGINEVMKNCGFNEFYGNYYSQPLIMEIDEQSTVMNFPQDASEEIAGWSTPVRKFLWDDSSTAYSPISEQPNGLVLYPIGWHGTGELSPGISTTIRGSVGFLIEIATPTCGQFFQQGTTVTLTARIVKPGTAPYTWEWTSSVSGSLGKAASINVALEPGRHVLTVKVRDSQRFVATAWVSVTMIQSSGKAECLIFSRNDTEVLEYYPLQRKDGMTAVQYYAYENGRSHTYDGIEDSVPLSLNMALFDDNRGSLSLVFIASENPLVTTTKVALSMTQGRKVDGRLVPVDVSLRDDPGDIGFIWSPDTLSGSAAWTYQKTTKGFILGNLPHAFMDRWCVTMTFDHPSSKGVNWVNVFGHPKSSTTWPSPFRVDTYQYAEPQTKTITFCRAQCGCPTQEVRTNYWGFIEPIMFNSGNPGNINKLYNDKTSCSWSIQPQSKSAKRDANEVEQVRRPEGIAFHWDGGFDIKAGDSLTLTSYDAAGKATTVWTATGATAPAVTPLRGVTRADLSFSTNGDGNAGEGWTFHYYAMPSIFSISPKIGPAVDRTVCTITGAFFIDSPAMGARLIWPNGSAFNLPVKYISENQIQVTMPQSRPIVAKIQVSNDNHPGHDFWTLNTNVTYEWFDATCKEVKTCAGCAERAKDGCAWCNNLNTPGLSFCYATAEATCPKTEQFKSDSGCCTVCGPLKKCNGGGKCECNETCTCDAKHWANDCSCLTCPAGVGKPAGGPANFNCSGHGKCGCDGKCTCERGYRGDACECKVCGGNPTTCSGNGECECDGTCTCKPGWTHSIPENKVCDCSTECPNNCSGHGRCVCGVCECEAEWASQPDCGCIDECKVPCNDNQICQCNGTCACLPGFHGSNCSTRSKCDNFTDCTLCMATPDCGWCDDANVCENVFDAHKCGTDVYENPRGFIFVEECIIGGLESKDIESENRSSVLMAALVGTVLAAGLAMAAAAALMRAAPVLPPGFSGLGDGAGAAYQESAIYEASTNVGTSVQ